MRERAKPLLLSIQGRVLSYLSSLVLGDLVLGVLLAVLALAVGAASLWYVHLLNKTCVVSDMVFSLFRDVTLNNEWCSTRLSDGK